MSDHAGARRAPSPRLLALMAGVLALQLGFILSYVGAFHAPSPHRVPIAVVAPSAAAAGGLAGRLDAIPGAPLRATAGTDEASARSALQHGSTSAVLVAGPAAGRDTLLVGSGAGTATADAVTRVVGAVEAGRQRQVTVSDAVPLRAGDNRGLTGFYAVVGWLIGGYLLAAVLGIVYGTRPTPRRAAARLAAFVPYALLAGVGGAIVVGPALDALPGHFWAVAAVGALVCYAAAAVTLAFEALLGVVGIGLTVLLFVVLGNPSAGGAYQLPLLPPFWRAIGPWLPNGAGVDLLRRVEYLHASGVLQSWLVLAAYAAGATLLSAALPRLLPRPGRARSGERTPALAGQA